MVLIIPLRVPQLPDKELLCQADKALSKVTRCKEVYEPLITNLKRLHGKKVGGGARPCLCCAPQLWPHDACAPTLRVPHG